VFGFTAIDKNNILVIRRDVGETKYSAYLSVLYFEDVQPFEDYEKSPELATFTKPSETFFLMGTCRALYSSLCPVPASRSAAAPAGFILASITIGTARPHSMANRVNAR
jgi:hypothetical protein